MKKIRELRADEIEVRVGAVSYTHLDVYKRQAVNIWCWIKTIK